MARILKRRDLSRRSALMVGDSYVWDYLAEKNEGIDGLLIDTPYRQTSGGAGRIKRLIKNIDEVLPYLNT